MIVPYKQYVTRQGYRVVVEWHNSEYDHWNGYVIDPKTKRSIMVMWDKETGRDRYRGSHYEAYDLVEFTPDERLMMARREMKIAADHLSRAMTMLEGDKDDL
jgi:hypothetical protein